MELYKKRISDLGRIVTGKTPRTSNAENYVQPHRQKNHKTMMVISLG